ncbi:uncharacterized protein N7496_000442 [Penicillium cataractarum]|uniref:Prolyl 4-hydroxylase alpha subunit domain-containing protein n=1 Tax=Penicillium cataractarum TaxID=2100454 RepID=A0A9X0B5X8_9EURO|nr:uncharacterized protein N7496_000442 [Penicillium cataractarum]KAJ5389374.1 hypothetical protein N7496_000442 [Penicillium cataractarum]
MSTPDIPPSFLQNPPPNATIHPLDFTKTTPPIPAYKDHFAAVIDNFMTPTECTELLRLAGESAHPPPTTTTPSPNDPPPEPTWQRALVNAGSGTEVASSSRKSGRYIWDSPELASRLLSRLTPFLTSFGLHRIENQPLVTGLGPAKRGEVFVLAGLNERIRFLRYEGGDYFRPHWDGCYVDDGKGTAVSRRSLFTVHLYLNGEGEQDWEVLGPEVERVSRGMYLFEGEDGFVDLREVGKEDGKEGEESRGGDGNDRSQETLLGGATSFGDDYRMRDSVRVFPKTGSLLIFQQRNLMHSGDDVFRGVKYTVRTDVISSKSPDDEQSEFRSQNQSSKITLTNFGLAKGRALNVIFLSSIKTPWTIPLGWSQSIQSDTQPRYQSIKLPYHPHQPHPPINLEPSFIYNHHHNANKQPRLYIPRQPPEHTHPLTASQIWKGLLLKSRSAETFVSAAIQSTTVLSDSIDPATGNQVIIRDVLFRESQKLVKEVVTAFEPTRVEFEQPDGSRVSNVISVGAEGELYLTYIFEWRHPEFDGEGKEKSEEWERVKEKERGMGQSAVEGSIKVLRRLAEEGAI